MKKFQVLLTIGVLMALAIGCGTATSDRENLLTAAGFKIVPADTPEKLAYLNSLPSGKVTPVQRDGSLYYTFPDANKKEFYIGQQRQYQEYQKLRQQKKIARSQRVIEGGSQ